jgi:Brp/Blh family beta-carotene 15,15'-monooxygenase
LRLQGQVFCGVTLAIVMASLAGARLEPRHELMATGALVLLLGMPHGAFDMMIARRLFGTAGFRGWTLFSLGYLGLSAAVVGVWIVTPAVFLCTFLIVSAFHFAGDPATGVPRLARGLYGGAVIVLPAVWHVEELQRLLGLVAGSDSAAFVAPVLSQLALPWLAATMLVCAFQFRTSRLAACESAGLAVLSLGAPPLVAFCAYFCLMHSPRHILRTFASLQRAEARQALALALWPTLAVLIAAALVFGLANDIPLEARVMQLVFVGLAALTLPHMLLIECVRQSQSSRSTQSPQAPAAND